MVLLAAVAMQTSKSPHPATPSPHHSFPTTPLRGGTDGFTPGYAPAFSKDQPNFCKGYTQLHSKGRRNSTGLPSTMRSPVTSPVHSSLTNLDVWSPNSVSIDALLRHSVTSSDHSKSGISNGFAHVRGRATYANGPAVRSSHSDNNNSDYGEGGWNHYQAHSGYRAGAPDYADLPKTRSLRRTLSADPRCSHNSARHNFNRKLQGSTSQQDPSIPRVCSDGDLLETEQESLDSGYFTEESRNDSRYRRYSEITRRSGSRDSGLDTAYHHHAATTRESRKDMMYRKYSDTTPLYANRLHTSASFSDFGIYKRYHSDESDFCYDSSYSSGYSSSGSVSARNGSGSTGSLQRSGTVIADRAVMGRALSAERTFQISPMDRARGLPSRKKSSQTLQTVAENMVQGVKPTKSILKNGRTSAEGGAPMPRSASSSRRSSLTSYGGGTLSSDNLDSLDVQESEVTSTAVFDRSLPAPTYTRGRQPQKQEAPLTRGASGRSKARRSSHPRYKHRSKSLSDLRPDSDVSAQQSGGRYSDDEDGDDFGFLSHPLHAATVSLVSASSAVSGRASSSSSSSSPSTSSSQRLLPRRWRNKGKNSSSSSSGSSQQAMWNPEGPCTWCCVSGRRVVLKPVSILQLSEAERLALQKLASSRLQNMDLGCPIIIPKDNIGEWGRQRKRALSLKRKCKSANLGSLLDTLASSDKGKDKDNKDSKTGLAFGIPLSRVILNDRQRPKKREETPANPGHKRSGSADLLLSPVHDRKSSSSSQGSLENGAPNGTASTTGSTFSDSARRVASTDSLTAWDESIESNLIEALSLSSPGGDGPQSQLFGEGPQVPRVVTACFHHLENHGLNVVGIFRVGSSKKRVKQLREEFDSGQEIELTEEHNVHDVGALLKEFFRDLPEPLLTRDLFLPFVATRKIKEREKQAEAMRLLLTLLPVANRDTLWALLRFLLTVHNHSEDRTDENGKELPGNKMDSQNLATLFGPNVLHCLRAVNEKQLLAECAEQAEQSSEVIGVTKDLIDNHTELFEISSTQHDEVLKLMMEADRENLEMALRRLSAEHEAEAEPDNPTPDSSAADSLPHTANSDADLLHLVQRKASNSHQPLRLSRSADPWTDGPHASADPAHLSVEGRGAPPGGEDTASEPCRSPRRRRPVSTTAVTGAQSSAPAGSISSSSSSQDAAEAPRVSVTRRRSRGNSEAQPLVRQGAVRERPYSDNYPSRLAPPRPPYSRESSGGSSDGSAGLGTSPGGTSTTTPTSITSTTTTATAATTPAEESGPREGGYAISHQLPALRQYPSASTCRYRTGAGYSRRQPEEEDKGDGAKWQRERWRHWQQVSAERQVPDTEQETLV